jgi:acetyltransferase-like isoleucine patch superfamily enzyme
MIPLTQALIEKLKASGVTTHHGPGPSLPDHCFFEPPCSFKWMQISYSLSLGAFSYAVSGYYNACTIGRYVSIGEEVQVGRQGHPTSWASTSPIFYQPYQGALNLDLAPAAGVTPDTFLLGKGGEQRKYTRIGNDVYIGHGAFIMAGVNIGDGAVIGANAVVTRDVPPYAIAAGVPATVRRMRFSEDVVGRMLRFQWWRFAFWDLKGASLTEPNAFLDTVERRIDEGLQEYQPGVVSLEELAASAGR